MELAKELFGQAEELAASDQMVKATGLYEQAYHLVPGKHGFAYKVGLAAYLSDPRDCTRADDYLKHYLTHGDPSKHPEWVDESNRMLGDISATGCADVVPAAPAGSKPKGKEKAVVPVDEGPTFIPIGVTRAAKARQERIDAQAGKMPGVMKAGIALSTVGVLALSGGVVTVVLANQRASELAELSSSSVDNTSTGFPMGDFDCRVPGQSCADELERELKSLNAGTVAFMVGGGVLSAAGGGLIVLGVMRRKKQSQATITPIMGRTKLGLSATVRF